jgi:hypothetical protein
MRELAEQRAIQSEERTAQEALMRELAEQRTAQEVAKMEIIAAKLRELNIDIDLL